MTLIEIIREFRRPFFFAISLVVIEKLAWIIEPTAFGRLLDALIAVFGSKEKVSYALPLIVWVGIFALNSGAGAVRRFFDEKIYLRMFSNIAVRVAETSREKGLPVSKIAARVELTREYVAFLKRRIPDIIEQCFDLGGTQKGRREQRQRYFNEEKHYLNLVRITCSSTWCTENF